MFLLKQTDRTLANENEDSFNYPAHNRRKISKQEVQMDTEFKCIQKYETSNHALHQICKFRSQEGFYLTNITKEPVRKEDEAYTYKKDMCGVYLITFHFKRFFTQTTSIFYKLSYYLSDLGDMSDTDNPGDSLKTTEKPNETLMCEIWMSWTFLHLKSKYQNLVLIEQLRQSLNQIKKIDLDGTFELTAFMLNPPEILKLKEPLFKFILANNEQQGNGSSLQLNTHVHDTTEYNCPANVFNIQNLNFELNIRSSKEMENEFFEFANVWMNLAFFKYSQNTLKKYFGMHTIKLIMDHDRPMPDNYAVLFDLKTTFQLMTYDLMKSAVNSQNTFLNSMANQDYNLYQESMLANCYGMGGHNPNHHNINNIFQCQNALNKLCVMLIDWCDIVLVENCVFLKFVEASVSVEASKSVYFNNDKKGAVELDPIVNEATNEAIKTEQGKKGHSKQPSEDLNVHKTASQGSSFVLIKIETQHVPFVSLQFLFHASISYWDRMLIVQRFKEKLCALNLKNISSNTESPSSTPMPPPPAPTQLIPSVLVSQNSSKPGGQIYKSNNTSNSNLSVIDAAVVKQKIKNLEYCYILQKPDLFDAFKSAFLDDRILNTPKLANAVAEFKHKSQILNFMEQKKFKWIISKSFSYQTSLSLKETIIDTFVRIRLEEGFKCVFQNAKLAVFSIQLAMFDSGEFSLKKVNATNENDLSGDSKDSPQSADGHNESFTQQSKDSKQVN